LHLTRLFTKPLISHQNHLHFGRELATSLDILLANPKGNDEESYGEFAANMAERMQFAFGVAREVARQ
jgi:hypothetical protein